MELVAFERNAKEAAELLKVLSHPTRLMVLCILGEGSKKVQELEQAVGVSQSSISQHLGKLRMMGLVDYQKEGVCAMYYIKEVKVLKIVHQLKELFCGEEK